MRNGGVAGVLALPSERVAGQQRTVALIGHAPSTRGMVPVDDPLVEKWYLGEAYLWVDPKSASRWFEMHRYDDLIDRKAGQPEGYMDFLRTCPVPIYMWEAFPDFPNAVRYPLEDLAVKYGGRVLEDGSVEAYFTSSIAYMLAMAVDELERGDELRLYGIDMSADTEYIRERAGAEFWLGIAIGKGIKLVMPEACPLLRAPIYGKPHPARAAVRLITENLESRIAALHLKRNDVVATFNAFIGMIEEGDKTLERLQQAAQNALTLPQVIEQQTGQVNPALRQQMTEKLAELNHVIGACDEAEYLHALVPKTAYDEGAWPKSETASPATPAA